MLFYIALFLTVCVFNVLKIREFVVHNKQKIKEYIDMAKTIVSLIYKLQPVDVEYTIVEEEPVELELEMKEEE